jgi:hypothetical protein
LPLRTQATIAFVVSLNATDGDVPRPSFAGWLNGVSGPRSEK